MLERYELIKVFPGSPMLGTIVYVVADGRCLELNNPKELHTNPYDFGKYAEFWKPLAYYEDVIILHHIDENNNNIITHEEFSNLPIRERSSYKAYRIKRTIDSVVFQIGDRAQHYRAENNVSSIITNINIDFNKGTSINTDNPSYYDIHVVKPIPKLFTTIDGVDIYQDDIYWIIGGHRGIFEDDKPEIRKATIENILSYESYCIQDDKVFWLKFYDQEKAKRWLEDNKPKYSIADIESAYIDQQQLSLEDIKKHLSTTTMVDRITKGIVK